MFCGYAGPEEKGEGAASKGSGIEQEGEGMPHMTHAFIYLSVLIKHDNDHSSFFLSLR